MQFSCEPRPVKYSEISFRNSSTGTLNIVERYLVIIPPTEESPPAFHLGVSSEKAGLGKRGRAVGFV